MAVVAGDGGSDGGVVGSCGSYCGSRVLAAPDAVYLPGSSVVVAVVDAYGGGAGCVETRPHPPIPTRPRGTPTERATSFTPTSPE